jgi:hypothetical protein
MPIYNYNGVDFTEEEVLSKAEEKGLDIDTYINKFGIKRIEDEPTIEPPGKPKPAVKKGAVTAGKPKSTASKSVKPSSVSQDNIFGEDKIKSSFLGKLQESVDPETKTVKPASVKPVKPTTKLISEYQAEEAKKEEGGFMNYIKESLDFTVSKAVQSIYKAPEYAYDFIASNFTDPLANTLREAAGFEPVYSSSDQIMETFGIKNIPADILQERIKESNKVFKDYSDKNGVDPLTAIENGNYLGAAKLVAGGTVQSFAPMAAAMLSGGSSAVLAGIGASAAVSKSEELKAENPEMDTRTRVNNAAVSGLLERYVGQFFTGISGSVAKRIIADKGAEAGSKILANGWKSMVENAIEKNPLIGAVGEVVEEGGVELANQLNDMNSGIRKELDYRAIANAGIIATGMAGTNTVPVYAAKGYMKAAEYNKVKSVNKEINNLTTQLSNPFVSDSDKKIISSRVTRLVDENKAIVGANLEKINALPDSIKEEISVLNTGLDNIKSKYLDLQDNPELPIDVQESMTKELAIQAKDLQKRKSSIIEGNYIYEDFKKLPEAEQTRIKDKATEMLIADSDLIGEGKTSFNEEEINRSAIDIYNAELRTKVITTDIERTQQAIKNIGLGEDLDMPELNTANDVIKYLTENTTLDTDTIDNIADDYGSFIPLANGKEALLINKEAAEMDQVVTTGQHEFLHKLIYKAVLNDPKLQKQMGTQLYNHIENYVGTEALNDTKFKGRYDTYKADFEETKSGYEATIAKAKAFLDKEQITQEQYDKTVADADSRIVKAEGKYLEEVLPLLSESLSSGDIKYNETFFTKIGDIIRRVFQKYGLSKVRFDTGKDVFNFVRDYNKSFEKGQFNKAFKALAKEGSYKGSIAKGNKAVRAIPTSADIKSSKVQVESLTKELQDLEDEYDEGYGDMEEAEYTSKKSNIERKIKAAEKLIEKAPVKEEVVKKEKTKEEQEDAEENALKKIVREEKQSISSDKVQKIYDEKGRNGADQIIKLFRPITKRIVDKRRDAPDFDNFREILTDEIETGVGGILDLITKYKPESGVPLAAYINKYLPVRAIAASRRVLGKEFSKDASEETGLMATETADQNMTERVVEKPKYKNALESKVFEPETLESINSKILTVIRTLKSRIDAPITLNRTVTPLITEIRDEIGKQVDIDVKSAMGTKKDNQLRNWLLKNKKYVLENMTTTWLMGKDGQGGMPIAIQKRVDGKWTNFPEWVGKKIDRESMGTDNAGRTSGRELARRLPNVANNISDTDFLDQIIGPDGNPIRGRKESLAKVVAEEASFDIILDDLANEGPIFDALKTNQERQGVEVFETLAAEMARQAERGNVKQSKKVAKEVLTVLSKNEWDLNNEDYKNFVSSLSKEDSDYVTNVLQEKSIKQLRKYLKVIDIENKEFDFKNKIISALEDPVEKVLSKINRFKLISQVASTSTSKLTDLKIEYKKNTYNFELKVDKDSRLKGVVINNVTTNPTINKNTGINDVIADALKNDTNVKAYTDYLLANGGEIVANGSIKVPISVFKDPKARDLQDKAKVRIRANADLVKNINGGVNDAITFGGIGTFSYGDTKFEGVLPDLEGDVDFEVTTQRGSMDKDKNVSVYFIGFPKMAQNWDQKSPIDIHDKPKKLLTIIRKASLLKRNRISAKAVKTVLNAARPSYAAKPKKISVIDIDERLAKIKKKISYKDKEGKVKKLTVPEFLKQQMQLELDGIIFDYTDVKDEVGKNKDILDGFDNTDPDSSFGVTTESTDSSGAIQVLLQNVGVNIPANNINTLDDSTDQAKADWVTGKFSEGFNDFNIAGDKFKNSIGVKTILEDFDVKGEKQQKKLAFFNSLDGQFNKIISQNTGIGPMITYSDIVAKRRGARKGIFDVYVPPSAADFELLLYKFLGKGAKGEEQYKFFRDALLDPYSNGTDLLDAARQSIKNDYKKLLKEYPFVKGQLEKLIPNSEFTYDQAIRVAIWDANGVEIPGLTKKDQRMLSNFVNNDPDLTQFKNGLLITGKQGKDWIKPEANWDASTIISDLHGLTEGNGRKKFLEEFIANAEQIFGKWDQGRLVGPNMNKVEAIYGTATREAIEDVVYRMTTGKNRSQGKDKGTNAWSNWVNNSTGTIMFLNTRSASLQLIGAVNFLNLRDNNPIAAGKAFLNPKQYWEDFATIWNSDKMKERRGGLKEDVASSEIANAAAGSKNKASAVISYLLKIGYTPTQLADSFAIASGGAPFYRNRINSYLKEGLTQEEAEDKAWTDFTKVSDETQQSGDPRDISQQQASPAGRLLLTFQNTAMQQSRIVKKSFLDLKNGRGDAKTHVAKITYYLAIQNIMFSALQQGLFAVIFNDDDDEEKDKKIIDVAEGVLDSILRGTGYYGAIVATLKNMAVKYLNEKDKNYKADYAKVVLEGVNISPPIGSKVRKVYSALQQTKFEKDLIEKRGWDVMQDGRIHLGPMYSVSGKLIEAGIGAPTDRLVNKIENVSQAMNSHHSALQRLALLFGWNSISLGIEETPGDLKIREEAKAFRKEAGKIKGKETRQRTKDSIKALPLNERIALKRAKREKRREEKRKERSKKRKMG